MKSNSDPSGAAIVGIMVLAVALLIAVFLLYGYLFQSLIWNLAVLKLAGAAGGHVAKISWATGIYASLSIYILAQISSFSRNAGEGFKKKVNN